MIDPRLTVAAQAATADDRAIVRAVLAGDPDAYRVLLEREAVPVVRTCQAILGDLQEAQEVAHEVFATAYRALASWRGDVAFGSWLGGIAERLARLRLQRRTAIRWAGPGGGALRRQHASEDETLVLNHDFVDRVMGALVEEPSPRALSFLAPLRRGIGGFRESVRQGWATARGAGRPAAGRVAALAYVLMVVVGGLSVTGVGAVGVINAMGVFSGVVTPPPTRPSPRPSPLATPRPSATPTIAKSVGPSG